MTNLPNVSDLDAMTNAQILALYNSLGGHPPVTRFADKKTAIKRTTPFLEAALAEAAAKPAKVRKARAESFGSRIRELILKGKSNEEILAEMNAAGMFPCLAYPSWKRSMMRKAGVQC